MRRALSVSLLLLSVTLQQACQRDEATAPHALRLSAQALRISNAVSGSKIAFVSDRDGSAGDIYVMNADGSAPTRLTSTPRSNTEPTWSPDARQLAFMGTRRLGVDLDINIYVMNADGSAQTQLTHNGIPNIGDQDPAWSPDGLRIAFTHTAQGIHVINADGTGEVALAPTDFGRDPSWSPDGLEIAFEGTASQIFVMNADGSAPKQLTSSSGFNRQPAWSPDRKQITFSSGRDGNAEIYVMNADGSAQTRLTDNPAFDGSPTWSPDGKQIAFETDRDGNGEIYVMNADGSSPSNLTNNPAFDGQPAWSSAPTPSGRRVDITFTVQPPDVVQANVAISPAIQVTVSDASGTPVAGGQVKIELVGAPGATLSGTTKAKLVNGVATFSDLQIDQRGQGYTLQATSGPLSVASRAFAVVAASDAAGVSVAR